jgi:hypothetical protein
MWRVALQLLDACAPVVTKTTEAKMKFIILIFALSACQSISAHRFDNEQGDELTCHQAHVEHCGLALEGCGPHASVEFECLKNVKYIGPVE